MKLVERLVTIGYNGCRHARPILCVAPTWCCCDFKPQGQGGPLGYGQGTRVHQAHGDHLAVTSPHRRRRRWPEPADLLGCRHGDGGRNHDIHTGGDPPCHRRGGSYLLDGRRASAGQLGRPRNRTTESPLRRTSGRAAFFIIYSA